MNQTVKTGYPSIDKPWLHFFSERARQARSSFEMKDVTMYDELMAYALNHKNEEAYEYLCAKYKYIDLINGIETVAGALVAAKVKVGEIIPIVLPNIPEPRYLIYACSKIGAIPNPIMPTTSKSDMESIIKKDASRIIFLMAGLR